MSELTIVQTPKGKRCSNKCDLYCTRLNSEPYCKMGWEIERDGGFISPDPDKCPGPGTYVLVKLEEWERMNRQLKDLREEIKDIKRYGVGNDPLENP